MLSYLWVLNRKILSSGLLFRHQTVIDGLTVFADKNSGFAE